MTSLFVLSAQNVLQKTAVLLPENLSFREAFERTTRNKVNISGEAIDTVYLREKADSHAISVSADLNLAVARELCCKFIDYSLKKDRTPSPNKHADGEPCTNAFSVLLSSQKRLIIPDKPSGKLNGPQKIYCDLVDLTSELHCGWTGEALHSGEQVLNSLSKALWYIDCNHKKLLDNACPVPKIFQPFQGYNNFMKLHRKAPVLEEEKLTEITADLAKVLSFPCMNTSANKTLSSHIERLMECLIKYRDRLKNDSKQQRESYKCKNESARSPSKDASCTFIEPKPKIDPRYSDLDTEIQQVGDFLFVDLDLYSPNDRIKRREFIKNLRLSVPIMLYRMAYGGSLGTLNFAWSVPRNESPMRTEKNSKVISEISGTLPQFSSRAMRRDFIDRYAGFVKCPKSILRHMYYDLTNYQPSSETADQQRVDERAADILLGSDDTDLLFDLRAMNGKDDHFDVFYEAMGQYFEEQLLQVQERRHGDELYLPFALSVEDLKSEIIKRVPQGTPVPSNESIRLQFMPTSQFEKTALRHTGRFNVKFRVQTRMARVSHPDAHYAAAYLKYLKEFCVLFRDSCVFVCMDDKAIIPVGEPGHPISTGVRGHNKVLAPADGPRLVATDHDFHLCGLIPSVCLVTQIPVNPRDSFFNGRIFVHTKDKVFQPSTPFRHTAELLNILRLSYSENSVDLNVPILCLMTDGGPDHRVTYESVKTSLLELFMNLDLDMLVALRTAPNNSWINPAERCMSILNLALQHAALARHDMDDANEKLVKNKSSLNAVRNMASVKQGFRKAFEKSVDPVIDIINDRFSRMSLKGEKIRAYKGLTEEEVEDCLQVVTVGTGMSPEVSLSSTAKSKDFKKNSFIQNFIEKHGSSSHYCFQLRKCTEADCGYCTINPIRDPELFEAAHFLPEPKPDASGEHYLPFDKVFGQDPTEKYRPSAKDTSGFDEVAVEHDKQNRDVFKAGKLRDVIKCGDCDKPRGVYSNGKLTREQEMVIRRVREEQLLTCGEDLTALTANGLIMRQAISCNNDIEIAYYSVGARTYLPPVCVYCGTEENLMNDYDAYMTKLYETFSIVRPLCVACQHKGLEAKTWGAKFFKKRK